jgi:methylenetetrahydrofolate reductase (NADPH)
VALAPGISFEFFPPRSDEQRLVLDSTWHKLARLRPTYLSVTFGAGGSTLDSTLETVDGLMRSSDVPVAPHISCMAPSRECVHDLLRDYRDRGVERLVVLRGDRQKGESGPGPFQYANELVAWIRQEFGRAFHIEVACYPEIHPESPNQESELRYFKQKVNAGADGATTQYFFDPECYFRFVESVARLGLDLPITPGIMPITNYRQLARFSDMCGAKIPQWIRSRLEGYGEDGASIREFGLEVVTRLCEQLLESGAPGLHVYTLNRANATLRLYQNLSPFYRNHSS